MERLQAHKMQEEVLHDEKRFNIIAVGKGSGTTTALFLKTLVLQEDQYTFVYPNLKIAMTAMQEYLKWLSRFFPDYTNKELYSYSTVSLNTNGREVVIKFLADSSPNLLLQKGGIILEMVDQLSTEVVDECIKRTYDGQFTNFTATTSPINCGWREFKQYKGIPTDEVVKHSWDTCFIHWCECGSHTRASVGEYKNEVKIITDYGMEDNPHLSEDFKEVGGCLSELARLELAGEWIEQWSTAEFESFDNIKLPKEVLGNERMKIIGKV